QHRRRPRSAQTGEGDEQDADDGHRHPVGRQQREGRGDVGGEDGNRHGQGEHIVDQQGRGEDEADTRAEVTRGQLVDTYTTRTTGSRVYASSGNSLLNYASKTVSYTAMVIT